MYASYRGKEPISFKNQSTALSNFIEIGAACPESVKDRRYGYPNQCFQ